MEDKSLHSEALMWESPGLRTMNVYYTASEQDRCLELIDAFRMERQQGCVVRLCGCDTQQVAAQAAMDETSDSYFLNSNGQLIQVT
ncbi:hypothetical protein KJ652_00940 [Patescibacteria group bacterium]|nr:hypothetical protein [Patescibacteria group bacterium]MBU1123136.1 hypothetical protein [Patescibacteria group bacterium]MBU1911223.1 hypothetical protein [Patescibacteria group bacterium]